MPDRIRTDDIQLGKLTTYHVKCRTGADLSRFRKRPVTWVETVLCRLVAAPCASGPAFRARLEEFRADCLRGSHVALCGGGAGEAGYGAPGGGARHKATGRAPSPAAGASHPRFLDGDPWLLILRLRRAA